MVEFDDSFVIGSHKTSVDGDSDIKSLRKKVDEIVSHHPPFKGKRLEMAFMAENADERAKQRMCDACKAPGVRPGV